MSDAVSIAEGNSEVLNANGVVEELVEGGVLNFLLILHLNLQHLPLVHVSVPNHVLRQVNCLD